MNSLTFREVELSHLPQGVTQLSSNRAGLTLKNLILESGVQEAGVIGKVMAPKMFSSQSPQPANRLSGFKLERLAWIFWVGPVKSQGSLKAEVGVRRRVGQSDVLLESLPQPSPALKTDGGPGSRKHSPAKSSVLAQ